MKIKLLIFLTVFLSYKIVLGQTIPESKVSLKLDYMAYACGECYAQYKVLKIMSPKVKSVRWLLGKEIYVEFPDSISRKIEEMKLTCEICFLYEVDGTIVEREKNKIVLIATGYIAYEKYRNCCSKVTKRLMEGRKESSN